MIPAFSIERTQILLYELNNLIEEKKIPSVPVFLDSPFAIKATEVYKRHGENFKKDIQAEIQSGDDIFEFPKLEFTLSVEESKHINSVHGPKIIIAGSGMSHGGRIIHHEKLYLPHSKNTLLLIGYQAPGTLGRQLQEGEKKVLILGEDVSVKAKIELIQSYSAHRDADGLFNFAEAAAPSLKKTFLVMGEPKSAMNLAQRLHDYLDLDVLVPREGESVELDFE